MRVKIWSQRRPRSSTPTSPRSSGSASRSGTDERQLLRTGGAEAELSDLAEPENRYERQEGKLLEAHTPIRTPDGTPVLFEIYQRFELGERERARGCSARSRRR